MILATTLRARFRMPLRVAAELFGVVTGTIAKAERHVRPLLDQRRHAIQLAGTHVKTLTELTPFAAAHASHSSREPKPRVNNLQTLSQVDHDASESERRFTSLIVAGPLCRLAMVGGFSLGRSCAGLA